MYLIQSWVASYNLLAPPCSLPLLGLQWGSPVLDWSEWTPRPATRRCCGWFLKLIGFRCSSISCTYPTIYIFASTQNLRWTIICWYVFIWPSVLEVYFWKCIWKEFLGKRRSEMGQQASFANRDALLAQNRSFLHTSYLSRHHGRCPWRSFCHVEKFFHMTYC